MEKSIFMEKYPVFSHKIEKTQTSYKSVDEIIEVLKEKIQKHPVAVYITVFDHYAHTSSLPESVILEGLKDAKNLLFCFGKQLPTTKIMAVRPRSIGISELDDSFIIEFLEVPNEQLQSVVKEWVESL